MVENSVESIETDFLKLNTSTDVSMTKPDFYHYAIEISCPRPAASNFSVGYSQRYLERTEEERRRHRRSNDSCCFGWLGAFGVDSLTKNFGYT